MVISRLITVALLLTILGCTGEKANQQLTVSMSFNQQYIDCQSQLHRGNAVWQLAQAQFFLADFELQNHQGQWQAVSLKTTATQTPQLALVGQNCSASDNGNWRLIFADDVELSQYQRIRFHFGVPFEINHLNPLTQASPLNLSSMFWVWQTGHKFARIELQSQLGNWLFHLGSTGCSSPSVMRAPSKPCRFPNLYRYELVLDENDELVLDLSQLVDGIALNEQTSCQSEQNNASCQQLFKNLAQTAQSQIFRMANSE